MRYEVIGAERTTGRDVTRVYEANGEDHATRQANADGIVVDSVDLLIDLTGRPTPPRAAPITSVPPRVTPVAPTPIVPPAVAYRAPTTTAEIPRYAGLTIASAILKTFAWADYALAIALLVFTLRESIVAVRAMNNGLSDVPYILPALLPSFGVFFAGAISHAAGSACVALRDIARNSWR